MIYEALNCLADEVNDYFRARLKLTDSRLLLSALVNQDGSVAIQGENRLVMTLVNFEKETVAGGQPGGQLRAVGPNLQSLNINLHVLISAYFSNTNYPEALKLLSMVLSFFHQKSTFTQANTPRLPDPIDRLTVEMTTLGLERMNNLWAMLGAKHMPSVLYKVKMLSFANSGADYLPVITGVDREAAPARTDAPPG